MSDPLLATVPGSRQVIRPERPSPRTGGAGATVGLIAVGLVLLVAGVAGVAALLTRGSLVTTVFGVVLGALILAALAAAVLVLGHPRSGRLEVVATPVRLVLPAPAALPWVNRAVASCAVALAVPPVLALTLGQGEQLPLFGYATPLVAAAVAAPAAVRAWRGTARYSTLTLDRDGVRFVGGRGEQAVRWQEARGVRIVGQRLHVVGVADSAVVDLGVRDLASDPRLVADLLELYVRRPDLRGEIGTAALPRLQRGDLH